MYHRLYEYLPSKRKNFLASFIADEAKEQVYNKPAGAPAVNAGKMTWRVFASK